MIHAHDAIRAHMEGRIYKKPKGLTLEKFKKTVSLFKPEEFSTYEGKFTAEDKRIMDAMPVTSVHQQRNAVLETLFHAIRQMRSTRVSVIPKRRGRPPGRKNKP